MEQTVRFCTTPQGRIAYATLGEGPAVVLPSWWVSHLERDWSWPPFRAFIESLAARYTVVRYDRLGVGLSDARRPPESLTLEAELEVLEVVIDAAGAERLSLLGVSCGGCLATAYAGRRADRVDRLVVLGGYAYGRRVASPELEASLTGLVRAHWGLGSRVLSDVFLGEAGAEELRELADSQRTAASAETAADLLALVYRLDARADAARVRAPALVVHRRGDRAVPYLLGLDLAGRIPGAQLATLEGEAHIPWFGGGVADTLAAMAPFLGLPAPELDATPARCFDEEEDDLSGRELEVLRLVAGGLSDGAIAGRLYLSPHTVHRHVANIRAKLRQPSRAAAVAHAARSGLL